MKTFLTNISFILIFVAFVAFIVNKFCEQQLDAPDVHVSYSTKQCVKIVTVKGQELPCSAKAKFKWLNYVWVK